MLKIKCNNKYTYNTIIYKINTLFYLKRSLESGNHRNFVLFLKINQCAIKEYYQISITLIKNVYVHSLTYFVNWFICHVLFIIWQIALHFVPIALHFEKIIPKYNKFLRLFLSLYLYIYLLISLSVFFFLSLSPNIREINL